MTDHRADADAPARSWFERRRAVWLTNEVMAMAVAVAVVSALATTPIARADQSQYEEFYIPPDPLPPGQPGDLIRTEPSHSGGRAM
jgi:hypothetical protein